MTHLITNYIESFKKAPKLRKASILLLLSGLLLMPITSFIALYSLTSFEAIIGSIKIPDQYVNLNIDIEEPETMCLVVAYSTYNPSVFPVQNIRLDVEVRVNFINKNTLINETLPIYSDNSMLPEFSPLQLTEDYYSGFYDNFIITNLVSFNLNYDTMSPVLFFMDVSIYAEYISSLISFNITHFNLDLLNF